MINFDKSFDYRLDENSFHNAFFLPVLTLNEPIATKVVCFSSLLKRLRSLYVKQGGPKSVLGPRCLLLYLIRQ